MKSMPTVLSQSLEEYKKVYLQKSFQANSLLSNNDIPSFQNPASFLRKLDSGSSVASIFSLSTHRFDSVFSSLVTVSEYPVMSSRSPLLNIYLSEYLHVYLSSHLKPNIELAGKPLDSIYTDPFQ